MKTQAGYRFSLQFAANSPAYIRAGEMLERLKHKKSDFIVRAVCEYLDRHPEIEAGAPVQLDIRRELFRRDELEKIVRGMLQQYMPTAGSHPSAGELVIATETAASGPKLQPHVANENSAVSIMLDNIEEFF